MIGAAMLFHMIVFSGVFPALSRIHISSAIAAKIAAFPLRTSRNCDKRLSGTVIGISAWPRPVAS